MRMTSTSTGFFSAQDRPQSSMDVKEETNPNEDMFRSSLKGFFTGGKKGEEDGDFSTRASSWSSYIGNPAQIVKQKRNFLYSGKSGDQLKTKDIHQLINDFKTDQDLFKEQVKIIQTEKQKKNLKLKGASLKLNKN